jgi:FMN-dependent oxidoreductase (nitrilotriacetate monooxygenase family)
MPRQLHLGGFQIASSVTHSNAAWRHPGSTGNYFDAAYYHRVGQTLERGKFDMVFFADLLAMTTRFGGDPEEALRRGSQASATIDPTLVATSIAAVTQHLGVSVTKSTTFFDPYEIARSFATLDHLSGGRAGWNIVTSLNAAEAQNFGADAHVGHDSRYDRAQEFLEVTQKLWSGWDADAIVADKASGIYIDPDKVRVTDHAGEYFRVKGPLNVPRSPQGRPVLIQAGASSRGKDFAAQWAEAIFEIDPTHEGRKAYYDDVKSRVANFGRDPEKVKILPAIMPFIGETESVALERQAFHNELADPIPGLITLSAHTDHDFSTHDLDQPLEDVKVPGSEGLFEVARRLSQRDSLTLRDIGKLYAQGVMLPQVAGTATQVADQLLEIFDAGECDGFMISAWHSPGAFDEFVDQVVPELQRRGVFRTEYTGSTLRDHLGLDPVEDRAPVAA